jgi:hypothetical protein
MLTDETFDIWVSKRRVSDTPQRRVSVIVQPCNRQPRMLDARFFNDLWRGKEGDDFGSHRALLRAQRVDDDDNFRPFTRNMFRVASAAGSNEAFNPEKRDLGETANA